MSFVSWNPSSSPVLAQLFYYQFAAHGFIPPHCTWVTGEPALQIVEWRPNICRGTNHHRPNKVLNCRNSFHELPRGMFLLYVCVCVLVWEMKEKEMWKWTDECNKMRYFLIKISPLRLSFLRCLPVFLPGRALHIFVSVFFSKNKRKIHKNIIIFGIHS